MTCVFVISTTCVRFSAARTIALVPVAAFLVTVEMRSMVSLTCALVAACSSPAAATWRLRSSTLSDFAMIAESALPARATSSFPLCTLPVT